MKYSFYERTDWSLEALGERDRVWLEEKGRHATTQADRERENVRLHRALSEFAEAESKRAPDVLPEEDGVVYIPQDGFYGVQMENDEPVLRIRNECLFVVRRERVSALNGCRMVVDRQPLEINNIFDAEALQKMLFSKNPSYREHATRVYWKRALHDSMQGASRTHRMMADDSYEHLVNLTGVVDAIKTEIGRRLGVVERKTAYRD